MIVTDVPAWSIALRSAGTPPLGNITVGSRAFSVAVSQIWNALPEDRTSSSTLRSFQQRLYEDFSDPSVFLQLASLAPSVLHLSHGFQCSPTLSQPCH